MTCATGRGFTLIELLIALVVLMIGIYGMLRVFPSGYMAVEATQQQTTASQLADSELARWKLEPESLPDAILATDYGGKVVPATLTGSIDSLSGSRVKGIPSYLSYRTQGAITPGATDYDRFTVSPRELALLDQNARVLLYNPGDMTPSVFDTVQSPPPPGATGANPGYGVKLHPNWEPNSLYLPRTIVGERIDIRSLPQMTVGTGVQASRIGVPFYLLSHAPCDALRRELGDNPYHVLPPPMRDVYFDVYDARPWRYRGDIIEEAQAWNMAPREFALIGNLGNRFLVRPLLQNRAFRLDYTDRRTRERVIGVTVKVGRNETGSTLPGSVLGDAAPDPATIQVYERMVPLTDLQYRTMLENNMFGEEVWPRNAYYANAASTVSGQIQFAPVLQSDPGREDIKVAKIDYRVYDWQILVFDVEVSSGGVVQLPVHNLKSAGYTNPPRQPRPQEIARGVREFYDAAGNPEQHPDRVAWARDKRSWAYVVAVDRQSGRILTDNELVETGGWPANPWMRRGRFNVNYREGLLYFNYNPGDPQISRTFNPEIDTPDRGGRTYRIFCRAQNDWAVQLMIASRLYARSDTASPSGNPVATGGGDTSLITYAWSPKQQNKRMLYFPLSETGQTVAVDYYFDELDLLTNTPRQVFVSGEVHTIGPPNVTDLGEWVCMLSEPLVRVPNEWGPTAVRGLSVRARATWVTTGRSVTLQQFIKEADRRTGGVSEPLRGVTPDVQETWHQVIVSTYLTRTPI